MAAALLELDASDVYSLLPSVDLTNMTFYYFGVEIEAIVEPHNKQQPVRIPVFNDLDLWYGKLAAALRNRTGTDNQPLQAVAEPHRGNYRNQNDRHVKWWVIWDGSLAQPAFPKHPGGVYIFPPSTPYLYWLIIIR